MKTKLSLLTAGILTAAIGTGFGQPIITTQPQSQTNVAGTDATFSVAATGTPPLNYQWQFYFVYPLQSNQHDTGPDQCADCPCGQLHGCAHE